MSITARTGISFLMTAYYENSNRISKAKPLFDTLIYNTDAATDPTLPPLLKSDGNGIIQGLSAEAAALFFNGEKQSPQECTRPYTCARSIDNTAATTADAPLPPLKILVPPVAAVSYLSMQHFTGADNAKDNWAAAINDFMKSMQSANAKPIELMQEVLTLESLAPAVTASPNQDLSPDEQAYNNWLQKQKQLGRKSIPAYILPTIRGLFVSFTFERVTSLIEIIVLRHKETGLEQTLEPDAFNKAKNNNLFIASFFGDSESLPNGMYDIEVIFKRDPNSNGSTKQWSNDVARGQAYADKTGKAPHSYTLRAMARFDHKIPGGEFSYINGDPMSVEESIITQFPAHFSYLINAANQWNDNPIIADIMSGSKSTSGVARAVTNIGLAQSWSDLANSLAGTKSGYAAGVVIGSALTAKIDANKHEVLKNHLETGFSWIKLINDKSDLRDKYDAAHQFLAKTADDAYPTLKALFSKGKMTEPPKDYHKTLASKALIPEKAFNLFGKAVTVLSTANNIVAIANSGVALQNAHYKKDSALKDYNTVISKYLEACALEVSKSMRLDITFVYGSANILTGEKDIEIAGELLNENPKIKVILEGYTCNVGSSEGNQKLSAARANAVRDILINKHGVDPSRITAIGHGETNKFGDNTTEEGRKLNRRVEYVYTVPSNEAGIVCREGIQSCERYRMSSVTALIDEYDEIVKLSAAVFNAAIGIAGMIFPPAGALAAAIAVVQSAEAALKNATVSFSRLIDNTDYLEAINAFKERQKLLHDSTSNQILLRDLAKAKDLTNGKMPEENMPALQYRIRAEAIQGLFNLLARAAATTKDPASKTSLSQKLEKYKVQAYIENFILNDGWLFPLRTADTMTMDEMWLFAINKFNFGVFGVTTDDFTEHKELGNGFYFAQDYRLLQIGENLARSFSLENRLHVAKTAFDFVTTDNTTRGILMDATMSFSLLNPYTTNDERANFQDLYPIHHLGTDNLEELANNFSADWSAAGKDYIDVLAIYTRTSSDDLMCRPSDDEWSLLTLWKPLTQPLPTITKRLNPYTQVKVVAIFNDKVKGIAPVNFRVSRVDGWDCAGPIYKSIARPISKNNIKDLEGLNKLGSGGRLEHEGKMGCIFHPFYQFGEFKHLGLKPMIPSVGGHWFSKDINAYANGGGLADMTYQIMITIGKNESTEIESPKIPYGLDYAEPIQKRLVVESFLKANSIADPITNMLGRYAKLKVFIRVGGSGKPWIHPDATFKNEISRAGARFDSSEGCIVFDNFDWNSSVEFAFVLACDELKIADYIAKKRKYYNVRGKTKMVEDRPLLDTSFDLDGPVLTGLDFQYFGHTKKVSSGESFKYLQVAHDTKATPELGTQADTPTNIKELSDFVNMFSNRSQLEFFKPKLSGHERVNHAKNTERHFYIAYQKMEYTNLSNNRVSGLRPFGNGKIEKDGTPGDKYYRYHFDDSAMLFTNDEQTLITAQQAFWFKSPTNFFAKPFWDKLPSKGQSPSAYDASIEWLEKTPEKLLASNVVAVADQDESQHLETATQKNPPTSQSFSIKSQAALTFPANRARTHIGATEKILLSASNSTGTVTWKITSGHGTLDSTTGEQVTYTAHNENEIAVIEASDGSGEISNITFNIDCNYLITPETLGKIFTSASSSCLSEMTLAFNQSYDKFSLDTCLRRAHFFAQVLTEVGSSASPKEESMNYSVSSLKNTFRYFRLNPSEADQYGRNAEHAADQEAIANRAYANRIGNGDINSGDGWKFRGRGYIQLTGKSNYQAIQDEIDAKFPDSNINIIDNFDDIVSTRGGLISAMAFWSNKNLSAQADAGSNDAAVDSITDIVNLHDIHRQTRKDNFHKSTKLAFNVSNCKSNT